ncbi:MAG: FAD-binding protein [Spirochaetaceae bacterium]|nr:MAG: FAD-binding protein [Spirochaetaceae bacterium]
MIAYDVVYVRADSVDEAVTAWQQAHADGLKPAYLSGGTELLTAARENRNRPDVLVDLKRIGALRSVTESEGTLRVGACVTLTEVVEDGRFGLLSRAAGGIADRSVRNSITIGGNVCGMLPYREALLPFLVADGSATVAGPDGTRSETLEQLFSKRLLLKPGELLVSLSVPSALLRAACWYRRRERDARVDYPLLTLCALAAPGGRRMAVSGAFAYPLRDRPAEAALNGNGSPGERAAAFVAGLPNAIRSDMRAGAGYRRALLLRAVEDAIIELEAGS